MIREEPACWSWEIPPFHTTEDLIEEALRREAGLPLDRQMGRSGLELVHHDPHLSRLHALHDGRCAICDVRQVDGHRVDDHCHETGQVRGLLCRSCNVREGVSGYPVFIRYRRLHPAALLDVHIPYHGRDWHMGWWLGEVRLDDAYERGPRPATPWKAWLKSDALDAGPGGVGSG